MLPRVALSLALLLLLHSNARAGSPGGDPDPRDLTGVLVHGGPGGRDASEVRLVAAPGTQQESVFPLAFLGNSGSRTSVELRRRLRELAVVGLPARASAYPGAAVVQLHGFTRTWRDEVVFDLSSYRILRPAVAGIDHGLEYRHRRALQIARGRMLSSQGPLRAAYDTLEESGELSDLLRKVAGALVGDDS